MTQDDVPRIGNVAEALAVGDLQAATRLTRERVPLHGQMGISILEKAGNTVVLTMELSNAVRGLAEGSIHGGMLATFADAAAAMSLGQSYDVTRLVPVTTDMHIRYYRQPRSGPLRAEATVVHQGSRLLSSECSITDAENRVLARSTATYMLVPHPSSVQ